MALKLRSKRIKRALLTCLSIFLIVGGLFIGLVAHDMYELKARSEQYFHRKEEKFKAAPNALEGLVLMHNSWERKEYKKTLYYADYCIKSGVDNTKNGWIVHMLTSSAFLRTGNQESACTHINLAVKLAQRDHIPAETLKYYGQKEILDSCMESRKNIDH